MGGEKPQGHWNSYREKGSPPHGRGKECVIACVEVFKGITPAWAGKRGAGTGIQLVAEDHPRMGGEKLRSAVKNSPTSGSPPHGRGKVGPHTARKYAAGITPAWAGKSYVFGPLRPGSWDHPRMGGEKCGPGVVTNSIKGSPPHGRGKAGRAFGKMKVLGITPAWAGKR